MVKVKSKKLSGSFWKVIVSKCDLQGLFRSKFAPSDAFLETLVQVVDLTDCTELTDKITPGYQKFLHPFCRRK